MKFLTRASTALTLTVALTPVTAAPKEAYPAEELESFAAARHEPLRPYYKALYAGGERNSVLNLSRLGLAAMEVGQWSDAERAFDAALLRIESVYAKNKQAEAARSLWHKESNKDWKGEPYERAMAYYYRGLLYLRAGDYNNARASFKGAEFQDTVSEAEEFQSDFALMNYLMGWSTMCAGDNGSADFDAAIAAEKGLSAPAKDDNVLMIAELGHGPVKARAPSQKEKLVFQPAEGYPETGAIFTLAPAKGSPRKLDGRVASSVYYQATTRGGRAMDGILNGKAEFKNTTGAIGNAAMRAGLQQGGEAGMYMAAAGAIFSLFSSAAKIDADIRQWDSLPDSVALSTAKADGPFTATVNYISANGTIDLPPTGMMQATKGKCSIVWTRARTALTTPDTPGDDARVRAAVARKKDAIAKDRLFRSSMISTFAPVQ
ncbi:hypothetical protein [Glacieibacterium frigidum]|uniref:Tetratricopeptide repeat protein n=1 Tax=Glacieibacterium frigidum TaxID=2593303 RepID=A0A552U8W5_9SPHN|nr:hypothetical protein [Glacieibacterium frigidum]TRW14652.1 hypothetical protein FMM06_13260 [Glacieibacterium frigidum]